MLRATRAILFVVRAMVDLSLFVGIIGMFLILCAFFMSMLKLSSTDSVMYLSLNIIGATMLIIYSITLDAVPFLVLNAVWLAVSFWGVLHHKFKN